jgi:hypothetical protein
MTVFGFGRQSHYAYMYTYPQHFVYGLMDGTQYSACAPVVRSSGGDLAFAIGQPEEHLATLASLLAPPDGATKQSRSLPLLWSAYPHAIQYRLQVAKDSLFSSPSIVKDVVAADTSYAMSGLLANTWYFWRVAAVMPTYTIPFCQPRKFQTVVGLPNQVKQVAPVNGGYAQKDSVVVRWRTLAEATGYGMEWTADSTFAYPDGNESITDTVAVLSVPPGDMYWRMRAKNDAGWGPYSAVWKFTATLTDVRDRPEVASDYRLMQNFPNPFNPTTLIEYALPAGGRVSLVVFNALGQTVAQLADEQQGAGVHTVTFEPASSLPTGMYFYRMSVNGHSLTKAMLLLR